MNPGDRVSWLGGIDMGAREVRWTGVVVGLGYGVPRGERRPDGTVPRVPAARVEPDLPQHGMTEIDPLAGPVLVPVAELEPIAEP